MKLFLRFFIILYFTELEITVKFKKECSHFFQKITKEDLLGYQINETLRDEFPDLNKKEEVEICRFYGVCSYDDPRDTGWKDPPGDWMCSNGIIYKLFTCLVN